MQRRNKIQRNTQGIVSGHNLQSNSRMSAVCVVAGVSEQVDRDLPSIEFGSSEGSEAATLLTKARNGTIIVVDSIVGRRRGGECWMLLQ